MNSDYRDVFSAGGPLARALPGYAYRPEQAAMAKERERRYESASYARDFLQTHLEQVKQKLQDSEQQLMDYATKEQITRKEAVQRALAEMGADAMPTAIKSFIKSPTSPTKPCASSARVHGRPLRCVSRFA